MKKRPEQTGHLACQKSEAPGGHKVALAGSVVDVPARFRRGAGTGHSRSHRGRDDGGNGGNGGKFLLHRCLVGLSRISHAPSHYTMKIEEKSG